jgi:hypothetical protein
MGNSIKTFSEFKSSNTSEVNEGVLDYLGNLVSSAGTGISDVIKGKAAAYLMKFFGISEKSILSKLVQNFVEQIPVMDLFGILFQGKANSAYLAPKAADATIEFLTEKGLDGIATDLEIETDGWIYRTISEMLSNEARRKDFRQMLESFYLSAFNGFEAIGTEDFAKSLTPSEQKQFATGIEGMAKKSGNDLDIQPKETSNVINNFLSGLLGNGQSRNSLGLSTGQTIN